MSFPGGAGPGASPPPGRGPGIGVDEPPGTQNLPAAEAGAGAFRRGGRLRPDSSSGEWSAGGQSDR